MMNTHNLGFPRIGEKRELKKALESFWMGQSTQEDLLEAAKRLRHENWAAQKDLDFVPVGDFSLYDQVLDMSFLLGQVPERAGSNDVDRLTRYFRIARGRSAEDADQQAVKAGEMTKWFDTNYHYIVPEFSDDTRFALNPEVLLEQIDEAKEAGVEAKPVLIGPMTYLWLGKSKGTLDKYRLLDDLLPIYRELLDLLASQGIKWVQIDEPILITDLDPIRNGMLRRCYQNLSGSSVKVMLATYFGALEDNRDLALSLPVEALHVDTVRGGWGEARFLAENLPQDRILSLGVIDGRNIWRADLNGLLDRIEPMVQTLGDRLWLAPSCSLLHVPVNLNLEREMDRDVVSWMAFARQKLDELKTIARALEFGRQSVFQDLEENRKAVESRRVSPRVHKAEIKKRVMAIRSDWGNRRSPYPQRAAVQKDRFDLPLYPTTTIGSFPQTGEIRGLRRRYRNQTINESEYREGIRQAVKETVEFQESLGLDVLVHGEAERNDMVEYFGEMLEGYAFSRFGWVQSYGSRCVKPPILYGDVRRKTPMTIEWIAYAQSLTEKPMKGMLTGPVTILNWSFVRDDQEPSVTCRQLALAVRDEVHDLEKAGIGIIQIDEAALREGLPLRRNRWNHYLDWAIESFRLAANGVDDATQIHTHMCYSEFNDIMDAIVRMDADVITIEAARSDMDILQAFQHSTYPNDIGPGIYDIHSPNVPDVDSIVSLLTKARRRIPQDRLWINPDCGLKTRGWPETKASLRNMVEAAVRLRAGA